MKAWLLYKTGPLQKQASPLILQEIPDPIPDSKELIIQVYPFLKANEALTDLKQGIIRGAKVLKVR